MKILDLSKAGTKIGATELEFLQSSITDSDALLKKNYISSGIVSPKNPALVTSETPLGVTIENTTARIKAGTVLFESGHLLTCDDVTFQLPDEHVDSFLIARVKTLKKGNQVNLFSETVQTQFEYSLDFELVPIPRIAEYSKDNIFEIIALITSSNVVAYIYGDQKLRRWSNIYDWNHRAKVGSGLTTESNPHGTTLFDMAFANGLGVWNVLGSDGIVSALREREGGVTYSGNVMRLTINKAEFTGSSTKLFKLPFTPLTGLLLTNKADNSEIPFNLDVDRRLLAVSSSYTLPSQMDFTFTVSPTLNFRVNVDNPYILSTLATSDNEIVVKDGTPIKIEKQALINLGANADYIQDDIHLRLDDSGSLYLNPTNVGSAFKLASFTDQSYSLNRKLREVGTLKIILANNTPKSDMSLVLKVLGEDSAGDAINETLTFNATWALTAAKNFKATTQKFSKVIEVQIVEARNLDISSTLQILSDEGSLSDKIFDVCSFDLTPTGIDNLMDLRYVQITPLASKSSTSKLNFKDPLLANPSKSVIHKDGYVRGGKFISRQILLPSSRCKIKPVLEDVLLPKVPQDPGDYKLAVRNIADNSWVSVTDINSELEVSQEMPMEVEIHLESKYTKVFGLEIVSN